MPSAENMSEFGLDEWSRDDALGIATRGSRSRPVVER